MRRILLAIDATPTEENRSALTRTEQIGRLTGATVYVLHVGRAHIVPGDIIGGSGLRATDIRRHHVVRTSPWRNRDVPAVKSLSMPPPQSPG